jgi:hypothetical protein
VIDQLAANAEKAVTTVRDQQVVSAEKVVTTVRDQQVVSAEKAVTTVRDHQAASAEKAVTTVTDLAESAVVIDLHSVMKAEIVSKTEKEAIQKALDADPKEEILAQTEKSQATASGRNVQIKTDTKIYKDLRFGGGLLFLRLGKVLRPFAFTKIRLNCISL